MKIILYYKSKSGKLLTLAQTELPMDSEYVYIPKGAIVRNGQYRKVGVLPTGEAMFLWQDFKSKKNYPF